MSPIPSTRRARRLALGALAALLTSCGDGRPTPPRDLNVVLLSIDTLRADRLGAYGNEEWGRSPSPHIDQLAEQGTLFEKAYVPRGQTHPSLASLLSGKYPITHGLRENGYSLGPEHPTIFEHLQAAGYQTGVFVSNFQVDVHADAWVARGADVKGDGQRTRQEAMNESRWQEVWDDRVEAAALDYLDTVETSRPFAMWAHFYDVHKPYNPPAEHVDRFGQAPGLPPVLAQPGPDSGNQLETLLARITFDQREVDDAELARIRGLYDATLTATDARIGRLLDKLDALGERENTLIVFTSDHGEELFDHNRYFFHGGSIYNGVVLAPLIVAGPDVRAGARTDALAQTIDVAPTILTATGLPLDPAMQGGPLTGLLDGSSTTPPSPHAFVEWQDLIYAVTDGRHKLIFNPDHVATRKTPWAYGKEFGVPDDAGFEIACVEAYDLDVDPLEQQNLLEGFDVSRLSTDLPPHLLPLYTALVRWLADPAHAAGMGDEGLSDAQMERMANLGYVGSAQAGVSTGRRDSVRQAPCIDP